MADIQALSNLTTTFSNATADAAVSDAAIVDTFELNLLQNYSVLINKLEQIALGVDATLGNISVDHHELEISLGTPLNDFLSDPIAASRAGPPHVTTAHGLEDAEYSRVVSDIWIGVILTLLIVSVIFFICACFLYHKFQQWKNSYRTNNNESADMCRTCPPNYEVESLPSYTIVSGLPTYDDAIEQFRKAGILLAPPPVPIIKIFECKDGKDILNLENGINDPDTVSINSNNNCTCGGNANSNSNSNSNINNFHNHNYNDSLNASNNNNNNNSIFLNPQSALTHAHSTQFIELTPEQLAHLSEKRLSLQIAFPLPATQFRRNSRPRIDLRNNLLRSRAVGNTAGYEGAAFAPIHRSFSTLSLANERATQVNMKHRGSLF